MVLLRKASRKQIFALRSGAHKNCRTLVIMPIIKFRNEVIVCNNGCLAPGAVFATLPSCFDTDSVMPLGLPVILPSEAMASVVYHLEASTTDHEFGT